MKSIANIRIGLKKKNTEHIQICNICESEIPKRQDREKKTEEIHKEKKQKKFPKLT